MPGELGVLRTLVENLNRMGFYGFVLPWLLVFALVYALLTLAFKKEDKWLVEKKAVGLISLAIAFFVTAYTNIGAIFINIFGASSVILSAALMIVLFFALFGIRPEPKIEWYIGIIVLGLILLSVIGGSVMYGIVLDEGIVALLFMIILIVFAINYITKEEKGGKSS